jgi:hypothetical protein
MLYTLATSLTSLNHSPPPSPYINTVSIHIIPIKENKVQLDILRDRVHSHNFITEYCYNGPILLAVIVVNLLLCLI